MFFITFYFEGALGGAFGIITTSQFLDLNSRFYLQKYQQNILSPTSPNWIGCWSETAFSFTTNYGIRILKRTSLKVSRWLPWLIYGFVTNILAIYVFGFPRSIAKALPVDLATSSHCSLSTNQDLCRPAAHQLQSNVVQTTSPTQTIATKAKTLDTLKQVFKSFTGLLCNIPFVCLSLAYATEGIILTGFIGFVAQYFQFQFQMQASQSSLITGAIALVGVITGENLFFIHKNYYICIIDEFIYLLYGIKGTLFGAFLVSKKKWDATACAKVAFVCYLFTTFFFLILLLACPETQFSTNNILSSQVNTLSSCKCDNIYNPVCFVNNSLIITYQSPCHAGCTSHPNNESHYTDCKCLAGLTNRTGNNYVSISSCDTAIKCTTYMLVGIGGALIIVFFSGLAVIPHLKAMLGSLDVDKQSFGLGIKTGLTRILGNVTGPIFYGLAIDSTCKIWKENCYKQQTCEQYDNTRLSILMTLISILSRFATFVFVLIAFYCLRKQKISATLLSDTVREANRPVKRNTLTLRAIQTELAPEPHIYRN
jgi:hypothetical protein